MKNYYDILGVSKDASLDDIKKAYKKLAFEHHPDRNQDNPASEEKFKEITEAYEILSNPDKRQKFDNPISDTDGFPFGFNPFSGPGAGGGFPFGFNPFDFGSSGNPFGKRSPARNGRDIMLGISVTFYEALVGCTKKIDYSFPVECHICVEACSTCGGSGMERTAAGRNMMTMSTCRGCGGRGMSPKKDPSCAVCHGEVSYIKNLSVSVDVPRGCSDGSKLGFAGAGFPGLFGGRSGNLIIQVSVPLPNTTKFSEEQLSQLKEIFGTTEGSVQMDLR